MANKKLFYLLAWYITWTIIASLYSNKNGDDVRKEIKSGKKSSELEGGKVLFSHILWIHKKFFSDVSQDENVQKTAHYIASHKRWIQDFFESSKSEIVHMIQEHSSLWEEDVQVLAGKFQNFVRAKFDAGIQTFKQSISSASEKMQKVENEVQAHISSEKKRPAKKTSIKSHKTTKATK